MRILALTSRMPYPPMRGDKVRTYHFLRSLSSVHDVDLITFVERADDRAVLERELDWLRSIETIPLAPAASHASMAAGLFSPLPYQALYYRSRAMRDAVAAALADADYDLVYVHLFRMAPFVLGRDGQLSRGPRRPRFVVDLTDAVSVELEESLARRSPFLRLPYAWETRKIRRYEAVVAAAFDEVWVISDADAAAIARAAPGARIAVVPNGVDETLFALPGPAASPVVLFVGNLSVPHNIDAVDFLARGIMPHVRRRVEGATLRVVGAGAGEAMRQAAAETGFELAGRVPELADAYRGVTVFAAPLRFAAGIQNKILEAMAAGVPVVTTPTGNRGLGAPVGEAIAVGAGTRELADGIAGFLTDDARARAVGAAGREYVRGRFSWDAVRERAEGVAAGRVSDHLRSVKADGRAGR